MPYRLRYAARQISDVENFVDDILEYTQTWSGHLDVLRAYFLRLREASLNVKPSKCIMGFFQLPFLGHTVGKGLISPDPGKIECIKECSRPTTKKQVRSFLGLVRYYRKFIPNFSTIAAVWSSAAGIVFRSFINSLCNKPILCLPNFELDFVLRTDASDFGLGAVLLQEHEEIKCPVVMQAENYCLERWAIQSLKNNV